VVPLVHDLCAELADLGGTLTMEERSWVLLRLVVLSALLISGAWLFWLMPLGWAALGVLLMAGVAYALLLIATHEMAHGTLLGWPPLETALACVLSWPMAWPYVTYARLHRLHHRWQGTDPRDPERTEVLAAERQWAGPFRRWVHRHLLVWRILVLGGVGLIADTSLKGLQLEPVDPGLTAARRLDGAGVVLVHGVMLATAMAHGVLWRYLLFWLVLERVIGAIIQFRGLVEHHGLWHRESTHLLTQLYGARDVQAGAWLNSLMGGLPYHSAHHAFPWIPSSRLPVANDRIAAVLCRYRCRPVPAVASYAEALTQLRSFVGQQPS
jgi:fatty acid desaturase